MKKQYQRSLCWVRRDLRLHDHRSLFEATKRSQEVFVVFVFDSQILKTLPKNDRRLTFIYESLQNVNDQLKGALVCLEGDPTKIIPEFANSINAEAVFTNEDYEPYAKQRDKEVKDQISKSNIHFNSYKDHVIFSGSELKKSDGTAYKVFTPYKNAWLKKLSKEDYLEFKPELTKISQIKNNKLKPLKEYGFEATKNFITGGEAQGKNQLKIFLKNIPNYHAKRDIPSVDGTSRLSTHLRFGTISIRECVRACIKSNSQGTKTWLSELVWRDFFQMILDQNPEVHNTSFLPQYRNIKWPGKEEHFKAWCEGKTGFPIVDAGMRQLNEIGWMHNRLRMITASFLVKDLLIDWRWGEKYFAEKLLDFDLAANNGGWQWSASTGCDAQPYFRIFNPESQQLKFDPDMTFIKKMIPEFETKNYPNPIVSHQSQRLKALKLYQSQQRK